MPRSEGVEAEIGQVIKALHQSPEADSVPADVIDRTVREAFAERQDARVKDYVGLFAERAARERLRNMGKGEAAASG